jgi:hypothetical protein
MLEFTFLAAFLGTFISVTFLTTLAWREHYPDQPRSFSSLVAQKKQLVRSFRIASVVVSTLFTITILIFIVPKVQYGAVLFVVWTICYFSELLLATFPERGTIETQLHSIFAYTMALCMVATVVVLIPSFGGGVRMLEVGTLICMLVLAALAQFDKRRFIFYELSFIYMSHVSILTVLLALK